jgi:hypothetical protein
MGLPVFIGGLFALQFLVLYLNKRVLEGWTRRAKLCSHLPTLYSSLLVIMYLLYLYLTKTVLDVFTCTPTSPPDGSLYLSVVFEPCTLPLSGTQAALLLPALLGLVLYTVGYPALLANLLYRNRELAMEDQLLRAKGVGNDVLTNPHALRLRTIVNGEVLQDGNTRELVHKTEDILAYVSKFITLKPGDLILTGCVSHELSRRAQCACYCARFFMLSHAARPWVSAASASPPCGSSTATS